MPALLYVLTHRENRMACYSFWIVLLAVILVCVQSDEEFKPCKDAVCGLETTCFHRYNLTSGELDPVCVPNHGFMSNDGVVTMNEHVHYKKACPSYLKIGLNGDRLDCGPDGYVNECTEDSDCNDVSTMCCFNGCKRKCRKFWLNGHP